MKKTFTVLFLALIMLMAFGLQAQTMDYKGGYQFPTIDQDSVLSGLRSIRGSDYNANPLGDGVPAIVVTNYHDNGHIHIFKNAGNDAMELVWSSPDLDSTTSTVVPRSVTWGDLDNDGIIEVMANFGGNGIVIFEWDGVAGSWNFGDAPARIIASPLFPADSASYIQSEHIETSDIDGDGKNELYLSSNFSGSTYDGYYIYSIEGTYSTGDPGFSSVTREAVWHKNRGEYAVYGGGTPYAAVAANLDGTGNPELVLENWNYGHVSVVRIPSADTYLLADTTGGHHYIYGNYPDDCVSLGGGTAFDIDGDGRDEVYFPLYSANGLVEMVHFEEGDDLSTIDSSNIFMLTPNGSASGRFDFFGRAGFGDWDNDGKPNLYFAARHGNYVMSAEFQGGDKTDTLAWTYETIYDGTDLDNSVYSAMAIKDSAGIADTSFTLQAESEGTIAFQLSAFKTFFDDDKYEDILMPSQTWKDSIDVTKYAWNGTSFDTTEYKIVEPHRISLRMLESSEVNSIKAKDLTVILPSDYKLEQNFPNPFNPTTKIQFYLPINKRISLTVYNALGQKVKTLINNQIVTKGTHFAEWNGTNNAGVKVATGMYVYELKYGNFTKHKRMMLVK